MSILDQIIEVKKKEVELAKSLQPVKQLEGSIHFSTPTISLVERLKDATLTGIIAEYKRASPSRGVINERSNVEEVVTAYAKYGASGISVLTDEQFFKGSLADLQHARAVVPAVPLLRKDFIIDEYQVVQARSAGADVILLIAACLTVDEVKRLAAYAKSLNLEVLLEVHNEEEIGHICDEVDIVGVNNRDLKIFQVSIEQSIKLASFIPSSKIKISESGIYSMDMVYELKRYGYQGFLIGENFMREENPGEAFRNFIQFQSD